MSGASGSEGRVKETWVDRVWPLWVILVVVAGVGIAALSFVPAQQERDRVARENAAVDWVDRVSVLIRPDAGSDMPDGERIAVEGNNVIRYSSNMGTWKLEKPAGGAVLAGKSATEAQPVTSTPVPITDDGFWCVTLPVDKSNKVAFRTSRMTVTQVDAVSPSGCGTT